MSPFKIEEKTKQTPDVFEFIVTNNKNMIKPYIFIYFILPTFSKLQALEYHLKYL